MMILGIDSASAGCAVCVWQDGRVLAQEREMMERGQDARLIPMVQDVMARAGVDFAALDRVAVTRGPGSFTGIRIGLAAARGIGLAAGKPVTGIDRFRLFAQACADVQAPLWIVLESRRLELYVARRAADGSLGQAEMLTPAEILAALEAAPEARVTGDAFAHLSALDPSRFIQPEVSEVETLCVLAAQGQDDPALPLYIRAPDVTIKLCEAEGAPC